MRESLKTHAVAIVRIIIAAVVTTVIILAGLTAMYGEQSRREAELAETTLYANLAQACVLSLPVDPETGRDPVDVSACFTQYGFEAPRLTHP